MCVYLYALLEWKCLGFTAPYPFFESDITQSNS